MNRAFHTHKIVKASGNVTEIHAGKTVIRVWTHESTSNQKFKPDRIVNIQIDGREVDLVQMSQTIKDRK